MRRRPIRPRRPVRRQQIFRRRQIPGKLIEANRLFENGKFKEAGLIFKELAESALQREIPQAPTLFMKSGMSLIKASDLKNGEKNLFRGLNLLIERKKWAQLKRVSEFTSDKLENEGFTETAQRVNQFVDKFVPDPIRKSDLWIKRDITQKNQVKLVNNCLNCGANVNPKEIEWIESKYPICAYCGSILTTNE